MSRALAERLEALLAAYDVRTGVDAEFLGRQFDLGLAWVHLPEGEGGFGADPALQTEVDDALRAAGIELDLWRSGVGLPLVAPTLASFATVDQRRRFLRPMFTGQEVWCQLFSEPGAGSDLAGLATRAVRDGDRWVVNGQKVWTSLGHISRWGVLCARTDAEAPKHAGLTYFIADMGAEGVETRPLRQITGEAEFDEVFLNDVVIPDTARIGDVGGGWPIMLATLANERAAFTRQLPRRGGGVVGRLLDAWQDHGHAHPHLRDEVLRLAVRAEALRLTEVEALAAAEVGTASSAWSYIKLAGSELEQDILDAAVTLQGPDGLRFPDYTLSVPMSTTTPEREDLQHAYLFARAMTIAGGTSEIQRTVIADRVLKLPREPQPDRATPWSAIPRN